jgi:hypothetical protein
VGNDKYCQGVDRNIFFTLMRARGFNLVRNTFSSVSKAWCAYDLTSFQNLSGLEGHQPDLTGFENLSGLEARVGWTERSEVQQLHGHKVGVR